MDGTGWPAYAFMLVLLGLSAFFSASETAYSTVNLMRLRTYAEDGNAKAEIALRIAGDYDKTLSTILVGNNVVNIGASSLATVIAIGLFGSAGAAIATGVTTLLVLTFGEILPKSYAKDNAETLALAFAQPLHLLIVVLTPVSWLFAKLKRRVTSGSGEERQPSMTKQELNYMVEAIEEEGILDEMESDLVQSALEFDEITAQEILTPRVDMVAIDAADPPEQILAEALVAHYSRLPVYEKTTDDIVGVIHRLDLLEDAVRGNNTPIRQLMTPCMFIHRTMKLPILLGRFQRSKCHLAVVSDDYGGTLGVVSLEDVLEQLVGDIWDESDEVVTECAMVGEDQYEVSADMAISDFFDELDYHPKGFDSDFNTMGGWAMESFDRIPQEGDRFAYRCLEITVTCMEEQRIKKLSIRRLAEGPAANVAESEGNR